MPSSYTSLLGLVLPVQGELQGTWGDTVNDELTSLLDTAIAGTTTLSTDADVTLTDTDGTSNQARQQIILWTATGTVTRNITAPAQSKTYVVINATGGTQSIVIRGAGPTTGVTIAAGDKALVAWNGSDFVKVEPTVAGQVYPGAGIAVSTGTAWDTSLTAPTGAIVGTTDTQTLTNKTIEAGTFTNGYTEEVATANTGTTYTIDLANGSVQILTLTGNCTFTFPTATSGKSFMLLLKQDATGSRTVTWPATVEWPSATAPTITSTASKLDKFVFTADGSNWYGSVAGQNYTV